MLKCTEMSMMACTKPEWYKVGDDVILQKQLYLVT